MTLSRYTPMRRSGWIRRRKTRRIARRAHMRPYVAWIHTLPCCCELGVTSTGGHGYRESMCGGDIEANHAGEKPGMGLKAPDDTCIPMCSIHHRDWTDHNGLFRGWSRQERRTWADKVIADVRQLATPDNRDHADALEQAGLGRVVEGLPGDDESWFWLPLGADQDVAA